MLPDTIYLFVGRGGAGGTAGGGGGGGLRSYISMLPNDTTTPQIIAVSGGSDSAGGAAGTTTSGGTGGSASGASSSSALGFSYGIFTYRAGMSGSNGGANTGQAGANNSWGGSGVFNGSGAGGGGVGTSNVNFAGGMVIGYRVPNSDGGIAGGGNGNDGVLLYGGNTTGLISMGGGGGGSPLTFGGSTVEAGWTVSYYKGTSTTLDTTDPDTSYSISNGGSVVASGNMPVDIDTLGLTVGPSSSPTSYTVVASGLTFTMDGVGFTRIYNNDGNSGTSVVAEGMYIVFTRSANPATLSTDFVDTAYTLVSGSTTLSGSMPVDLNSLNLTPSYYTDPTGPSPSLVTSTYTGTASGASFTLEVNANTKLGLNTIWPGYSQTYTAGSSVVLSTSYPTAQATYNLYAKGAGGADFGGTLLESGNLPVNLNTLESLNPGGYTIILGSGEWFPLIVTS